ncbi:MAG: Maff2 family protein [Lachnospiraceae bacterium]|nr:Maff2 family protein [Lachnospiraceae bacterium]
MVHPYISNKLGITQLMAGGGVIIIATQVIPLLATLF